MTETLDKTISVEVLRDRREEIYDRIGYLKQIISQFPQYSTPTVQQELVDKQMLLRLFDEKISDMTKPTLRLPAPNTTTPDPKVNSHELPQSADKTPPTGYHLLRAGAWREAGDLVYTVAGWIVCNMTSGNHPEGGLYCRKIIGPTADTMGERRFAPLRFNKGAPMALKDTTPLFYISNVPFAQSAIEGNEFDESQDEDLKCHQMHEVRQAVERIKDETVDFGSLILVYLDHKTNTYQHLRLMWVEYEEPPDDRDKVPASPAENPAGKPARVRVVQDPYGLGIL